MANQITDNRTLIDNADSATGYTDLSHGAAGTLDTEIKIQGTGSIGEIVTNTRTGILFDAGSAQDWSNSVFYIWINCGIVGLLDTKANGGFAIRFTGSAAGSWREFYVGGSDSWPPAIEGGWVQFVVDIEATPSATNGTPPATNATRYVGWSGVTASVMTKMVDNTWIDEIRILADGTPGIIVEGRNGGSTDWTSADIASTLGSSVGTFVGSVGGSYKLNTPIQFGINDTTTHGFTDTNALWLWDNQEFVPSDFYAISALGNASGTTNVTLGTKSGTGDDATGSQGLTIQAASDGARWGMDFDDANLDTIGLYGCNFIHGSTMELDASSTDLASCFFVDCTKAHVSNASIVRPTVVNANTADGVAFMDTDDMGDIAFGDFQFSDGHAIEILTGGPSAQDSTGNIFTGYGADATNDAALYNNSAASRTITVSDGGTSLITVRDGTSASTTIVAGAVTVQATAATTDGTPIENANVFLRASDGTGPFPFEESVTIVNATTTATVTHTAHGMATADKVEINGASHWENNGPFSITVTGVNTYTYTMPSDPGSSPTGTITSTFVALEGLTNVSGVLSTSRVYSTDQPVTGFVRKGTASPFYKTAPLNGTIDDLLGFSGSGVLVLDE